MHPEKNCPPVRVRGWIKVRVNSRVEGQPYNCPRGNCSPVRVRVWLRVSFGAIFLEPIKSQPINIK